MDFAPVKELPGRVRVKLRGPVPEGDVSALEQVVRACPDVTKATVYPRNGEIASVQFVISAPAIKAETPEEEPDEPEEEKSFTDRFGDLFE